MAQVNEYQDFSLRKRILRASNLSVAVAQAGNTTILEVDVREMDRLFVQVDVTGQALDAFAIAAKTHSNGAYQTLYSTVADFTFTGATGPGILVGTSGDLTIIAAAASGWFILDVSGLAFVRVQVSSGNVAGSTVSAYAGGE